MGFEPMITVFERSKMVRALDGEATVLSLLSKIVCFAVEGIGADSQGFLIINFVQMTNQSSSSIKIRIHLTRLAV
jgi:hypothetical protein